VSRVLARGPRDGKPEKLDLVEVNSTDTNKAYARNSLSERQTADNHNSAGYANALTDFLDPFTGPRVRFPSAISINVRPDQ